jgi:Leucine-rich repeat (LRR) protein
LEFLNGARNNFTGPLPELGNAPFLYSINFAENYFTGSLPELGNAPNLYSINFAYNQLTGIVPSSFSTLPYLGEEYGTTNP